MLIDPNDTKPIYLQISESLENEIIGGRFKVNDKVYSQYQLADMFNINPATAAKGLNVLVDEGILYKRRGLGMFVAEGAKEKVISKRRNETLKRLIQELVLEAERLNVSENDLIDMLKEVHKGRGGE
ncbi:GntR family transcriptional regulator [Siminovitchia terrae]|uniref:GntR family transcriptional regulator n=1 Tax=Siminovitchia terrae TaxID=1914933 RepID=A0A429X6W5_SIMTE|nr:GntR family transcriptional regulator [Siminovitchia terrae]RST59060.1 GntR family transcriptional regulator [Siminovitchia terrae]GIN92307.1 GntR family transcriptional regulator [Siminovitchia terrae]GIN96659.1 GntR family transcriptional regulator [Siminovitchia terrae]